MQFQAGIFYHIFNRGNNQQKLFPREENYTFFLKKIETDICPFCNVVAYCLMPNHYHLLVHLNKDDDKHMPSGKMQVLNRKFGSLQSSYTRAINKQEQKTGSLFQQKMKVLELDEAHSIICFHYIHQNPVKSGLSNSFEDWGYSSYNEYCGAKAHTICNHAIAFDLLRIASEPPKFIAESKAIVNNEEVLLKLGLS
jgi:REP element-mobilizing transposase RayT